LPNCQKTSSAFLTRAEVPIYTPLYTPFGNGEGRGCSVCPSFNVRPSHHWNFAARRPQIYHHRSKIVTGLILITNSAACMPQIYHHWSKIVTGLILITNSVTCMPQILPLDWLHMYKYIWKQLFPPGGQPRFIYAKCLVLWGLGFHFWKISKRC
jgi:hypothetical protein